MLDLIPGLGRKSVGIKADRSKQTLACAVIALLAHSWVRCHWSPICIAPYAHMAPSFRVV